MVCSGIQELIKWAGKRWRGRLAIGWLGRAATCISDLSYVGLAAKCRLLGIANIVRLNGLRARHVSWLMLHHRLSSRVVSTFPCGYLLFAGLVGAIQLDGCIQPRTQHQDHIDAKN